MSGHTPGPWRAGGPSRDGLVESTRGTIAGITYSLPEDGQPQEPDTITRAEALANAARIVACVNACEGVPADTLAAWNTASKTPVADMMQRRFEDAEKIDSLIPYVDGIPAIEADRDRLAALNKMLVEALKEIEEAATLSAQGWASGNAREWVRDQCRAALAAARGQS